MQVVNRSKYVVQAPRFKPYTEEPKVDESGVYWVVGFAIFMLAAEILLCVLYGGLNK